VLHPKHGKGCNWDARIYYSYFEGNRVSQAGGNVTRIYPDYHLLVEVSSLLVLGGYQGATLVYRLLLVSKKQGMT
jgi:hypothetical protein